jgi:arylsulfatase A-like enzyme
MTDDQRQGMGVMPKTRRWFRGGARFTNAFATTPLCCPSRASILTGLYVHNHGVIRNEGGAWSHLDPDETFPVYLQEAGYTTALFGKYINRFPSDRAPYGFDRWAMKTTDEDTAYYGGEWSVDGEISTFSRYSTDVIAELGERFIEEAQGPWMMMLNTAAPHYPFIPEPRYADAPVGRWRGNPAVRETDRRDKPPYVRAISTTIAEQRRVRSGQLRTLMSVDDLVGRIRSALARTPGSRNTLVFFMTDNAFTWGDHGVSMKSVPYLDSVRIPLYIRWPGHVAPGRTDRRLVANIDIAPTIMDAAGLEPPTEMDGRSLLRRWKRDRLLTENLNEMRRVPPWAALITAAGRHYVEVYDDDGVATFHEEYDLKADPWEVENLLWDGAGTVPSPDLSSRLAADLRCRGRTCP